MKSRSPHHWLRIVALVFIGFISANYAVPAVKPQSQRGIIFPEVEQFTECFVDELRQVKGTCKKLADCSAAIERWKNQNLHPQTCYFNKFDHIVCCENDNTFIPYVPTSLPIQVQRRSEKECELMNLPHFAIVHGDPTVPKEFPFMAALGWPSNFNGAAVYRCGGALISSKFVLTAAHCVEVGGDAPLFVRLGGVNLTDPTAEDIKIKQIIVHPAYNTSSSYNDIALIELEKAALEDPACIWSEHSVEHNNVTAIGYGHTRFAGPASNQLLKAGLLLVSNDNCQKYYAPDNDLLQNGLAGTHICAGDPEKLRDTCQGDSGGPIVMKVERFDITATYVVGITSFGQGCAGGPPSIYTRTSSYIDWIENIVWPPKEFDNRRN